MSDQPGVTLYEYVGGTPFFERLVDAFYAGVEHDDMLRSMYPDDLTESKAHLAGFLVQYWGGPTHYSDARGHPRLRMRHAPFVIDERARDAWLAHMTAAVAASGADDVATRALLAYFASAADAMINAR
jgi:hemoglobin